MSSLLFKGQNLFNFLPRQLFCTGTILKNRMNSSFYFYVPERSFMHFTVSACFLIRSAEIMHQHLRRCGKRKEKLADFLIQALKQGALGILATVSQVLTSGKNKNRFLKRASRPFCGFSNFVSMTPVNKVICIFIGTCT